MGPRTELAPVGGGAAGQMVGGNGVIVSAVGGAGQEARWALRAQVVFAHEPGDAVLAAAVTQAFEFGG